MVGVGYTPQGRVPSRSGISFHAAIIQMEEGPRLVSNVADCPLEALRIDMPVEVWFEDVTPEFSLPRFRPVS